jgi:hypothetical protein
MSLLHNNITRCSFLQLPSEWEQHFGDLQFDDLAGEIKGLVMLAERGGCGVVLPISTFFTFNSRLFEEGIQNRYFLRDELNLVTKMVQWRDREGAVLDTTNPDAVRWYLEHVQLLLHNASYNIHGLKLLHIDVPQDAKFFDANMTFLDYSRLFYRDASTLLNVTLIMEHAVGFVSEPVFISLHTTVQQTVQQGEEAQCLHDAVPWALNLGVAGYPLIIIDASKLLDMGSSLTVPLLKRWLELAIFHPAFEIPNLPLLRDEGVVTYLRHLMQFRKDHILPQMQEHWAVDHETPILRPLWWLNPTDVRSQKASDQFLMGDMLVAPVLCDRTMERSIYFPPGLWQARNGTLFKGPQTVKVKTYFDVVDEQNDIYFTEVQETDINSEE